MRVVGDVRRTGIARFLRASVCRCVPAVEIIAGPRRRREGRGVGCSSPQSIKRSCCVRSIACVRSAYAAAGGRRSPACKRVCVIRCRSRVRRAASVVIERYRAEVAVGVCSRGRKRYRVLMYRLGERRIQVVCSAVSRGQIRYALSVGVFSCQVVVRRPAVRRIGRILGIRLR